jgi:hypothetical protein
MLLTHSRAHFSQRRNSQRFFFTLGGNAFICLRAKSSQLTKIVCLLESEYARGGKRIGQNNRGLFVRAAERKLHFFHKTSIRECLARSLLTIEEINQFSPHEICIYSKCSFSNFNMGLNFLIQTRFIFHLLEISSLSCRWTKFMTLAASRG